jgi:hypothetical protein
VTCSTRSKSLTDMPLVGMYRPSHVAERFVLTLEREVAGWLDESHLYSRTDPVLVFPTIFEFNRAHAVAPFSDPIYIAGFEG